MLERGTDLLTHAGLPNLQHSWALQHINLSFTGISLAGFRQHVLPLCQHSLARIVVTGCHIDAAVREEAPLAVVSGTKTQSGGYS